MSGEESSSNRKRNLDQVLEDNNKHKNTTMTSSSTTTTAGTFAFLPLQQLKLEAIFYPKFENENLQERSIRRRMLECCGDHHQGASSSSGAGGQGYVEVTLKHSGSLLLWSGGTRYYSKNATDNAFSHAGEILLRQHFVRAYWKEDQQATEQQQITAEGIRRYQECSDYVQEHRLTLSFEVVTAVLADHGDRPRRDFLILTAIADRSAPTKQQPQIFYSTVELMEFAQRYRLPHNDCWVYASKPAVQALFDFYDTSRETGTTTTVLKALTEAAKANNCGHDDDGDDGGATNYVVQSMYPHLDFQGDILEGIVIRYVPCADRNASMQRMARLAQEARLIRAAVPSSRPDCHELLRLAQQQQQQRGDSWLLSPVLTVNLRQVHKETKAAYSREGTAEFGARLRQLLLTENPPSEAHGMQTSETEAPRVYRRELDRISREGIDLPVWVSALLEDPSKLDEETRQVATLIQSLSNISNNVVYSVLRERIVSRRSSNLPETTRYLCIVRVIHDRTFQKFEHARKAGDMPLFRGFSFELIGPLQRDGDASATLPIETTTTTCPMLLDASAERDGDSSSGDNRGDQGGRDNLMLKMKFLPYMVRTFGCRNGLKVIRQGGPAAFCERIDRQFQMWGISLAAQQEWMPFFRAWAHYAQQCFSGKPPEDAKDLPPLSDSYYLDHLRLFTDLFKSGKFVADGEVVSRCKFQGLVVVVSFSQKVAGAVADYVANQLGGAERINDVNQMKPSAMLSACESGRGLVCSAVVEDGPGAVRKLCKNFGDFISVVVFGCSDQEISTLLVPNQEEKKMLGFLKGWRKMACARVMELPGSSFFGDGYTNEDDDLDDLDGGGNDDIQPSSDFIEMLSALKKSSETDERPGILVFFPAIPGCGKSAWVADAQKALNGILPRKSSDENTKERNLIVQIGDQTKEKFWPLVKRMRLKDRSSIYIADKNAPVSVWNSIGEICAATKALAVPVLPDGSALRTTQIEGVRLPDGSIEEAVHFYPFSLQFLAVCMARVIERPPGSHAGKLDASTSRACMIVVSFFSFYRKITADEFLETLTARLTSAGAIVTPSPIEVPFFGCGEDAIPDDLEQVMKEALQAQCGYERESMDAARAEDPYLDDLEERLRECIKRYRDSILGQTVEETISCSNFASALNQKVDEVELISTYETPSFIKIASIDVSVDKVHEILLTVSESDTALSSFLGTTVLGGHGIEQVLSSNGSNRSLAEELRLVMQTHVTLAHFRRTPQSEFLSTFKPLSGSSVQLHATALLWSLDVMALEVSLAQETEDGKELPPSRNSFPHITVWFQKGSSAVEANELRRLYATNSAQRVEFDPPMLLRGTISLWEM